MAKKFEIHYTRCLTIDASDKDPEPLTIDQLKLSNEYSSEFRCVWGGEYVDFHVEEGVIYPVIGSFSLLGCHGSGRKITVKDYSFEEFIEMLNSTLASEFILMTVRVDSDRIIPELAKIFEYAQVSRITDYSKTISDLEEKGLVSTCPSHSVLRTDERRFTLKPGAEKICSSLRDYIGESYEVDSLGTRFWSELTKGIEELWSSHLKAASPDHQ